jgi:BNR repeat-containing family member
MRQRGDDRSGCLRRLVAPIAIAAILPALAIRPTFAARVQAPASIETVAVIDTSNQAGWWTPLVENGGATFYAYDAPGRQPGTHVVYVAKRERSGATASSCLTAAGRCLEFSDDVGHHQPSIAVDGAGFVHVFTAMHSSQWEARYFRSTAPNSVTSFTDRSASLPDQTWTFTYPVLATAPDGGLYLAIRGRSSPTARGVGGRLYRYAQVTQNWVRTATFAYNAGLWVYPDDLYIDPAGRVHILYMWVDKRDPSFSRVGAYVVYHPASGRFANAAGENLGPSPNFASAAAYQPWPASYDPANPSNGTGVEVAKFSLDRATLRPEVAYRYRRWDGERMQVRRAAWDGSVWRRTVVYRGKYDTFPAVDVTGTGTTQRIYYVKRNPTGGPAVFVAERLTDGTYVERSLASTRPKIQRLSIITRSDGTDVAYLAAPFASTVAGELYLATVPRDAQA